MDIRSRIHHVRHIHDRGGSEFITDAFWQGVELKTMLAVCISPHFCHLVSFLVIFVPRMASVMVELHRGDFTEAIEGNFSPLAQFRAHLALRRRNAANKIGCQGLVVHHYHLTISDPPPQ